MQSKVHYKGSFKSGEINILSSRNVPDYPDTN